VELEKGKTLFIKLKHISPTNEQGFKDITFDLNGSNRIIKVRDSKAGSAVKERSKANPRIKGSVGAPMPGVVLSLKCKTG
jgi:pyruvate carboxylase